MNILFLCHRIPFRPNKGEKIRAYHAGARCFIAKRVMDRGRAGGVCARTVINALEALAEVVAKARRYVEHNHDWNCNLVALDRLLMAELRGKTSSVPVRRSALPLARAAQ